MIILFKNNKYAKQNNLTSKLIVYKREVKTNKNFNKVITYMVILILILAFVFCA